MPGSYGAWPPPFRLLPVRPDAFADTTHDLALLFALHAGVAFDNVRLFHVSRSLIAQLTAALQGRTVIGQAQGIVMHRYGLSGEVAFEVDRPAALGNENVFDAEIVVGENERPCWAGSGDRRKPSMPRS